MLVFWSGSRRRPQYRLVLRSPVGPIAWLQCFLFCYLKNPEMPFFKRWADNRRRDSLLSRCVLRFEMLFSVFKSQRTKLSHTTQNQSPITGLNHVSKEPQSWIYMFIIYCRHGQSAVRPSHNIVRHIIMPLSDQPSQAVSLDGR